MRTKILANAAVIVLFCSIIGFFAIKNQGQNNVIPCDTADAIYAEAETEAEEFLTFEEIHSIYAIQVEVATVGASIEVTTEETTEEETETTTEEVISWEPYEFISLDNSVQYGIKEVCDLYEINYDLVIAICMQESSLNPNCIGDGGKAYGLGQIREEYWNDTANSLGLYDWRTDAVQNATMVCYIIARQMNDNHMSMESALNIYRHGKTNDITEPDGLTYVEHIKRNLELLEEQK